VDLPESFALRLETWVAMHEDLRASRRCRVVFDALVAGMADYCATAADQKLSRTPNTSKA
jgi:hypothetical protein